MIYSLYESTYVFAKFDLKFQRLNTKILESLAQGLDFGNFILGPDVRQFVTPAISENIIHAAIEMKSNAAFNGIEELQEYIKNMFEVGQVGGNQVILVGQVKVVENLNWTDVAARDWLQEAEQNVKSS